MNRNNLPLSQVPCFCLLTISHGWSGCYVSYTFLPLPRELSSKLGTLLSIEVLNLLILAPLFPSPGIVHTTVQVKPKTPTSPHCLSLHRSELHWPPLSPKAMQVSSILTQWRSRIANCVPSLTPVFCLFLWMRLSWNTAGHFTSALWLRILCTKSMLNASLAEYRA